MLYDGNRNVIISYKISQSNKLLNDKLLWFMKQPGIRLIAADSESYKENVPILSITKKRTVIVCGQEKLFFHPSMALLRLMNILKGNKDRFLQAVNLKSGDTFLDATMGLASDTLIGAWAVGNKGKVLAVEHSPLITALVKDGLYSIASIKPSKIKNPLKEEAWTQLIKVSQRIKVYCSDHYEYISKLPDSSVDVIYFDPMFRKTLEKSASIKPVKTWSNPQPLKKETILEACRVAKRRVVLKERKNSSEFHRLGFKKILNNGKYSPIDFGIIELSK